MKNILFEIPYYKISVTNFEDKKKDILNVLKSYPEKKTKLQTFLTNKQSDRTGLTNALQNIFNEELIKLTQCIKKDIAIIDTWSVSYKKGDQHLVHNHASVGLSAILYLELDKSSPYTSYLQPWNDYITDTTIYHPVSCFEGDIIIVPSFVNHFSQPNDTKKIKRILAWDMKVLNA